MVKGLLDSFNLFISLLIKVIKLFHKKNVKYNKSFIGAEYGTYELGEFHLFNVIWHVKYPRYDAFEKLNINTITLSNIVIDTTPRCPTCKTELKETKTKFTRKVKFQCVNCRFSTTANQNSEELVIDVERIVKNKYENRRMKDV
ncbi:hypothetical protein BKP35_10440 [Anaerobacillus arseniciselenatis]|uniref:Uncharacterized protein n=1 Tax=Anaerobacillus arseniciselenatis TaxID=85682 RepID=A0A1S2LKA2_9BACI|nr:hypothetical protein [Anaerobacillus arseniciselenatis]OIJ12969.1 hypothetical protein BKP35_10440 [Anaerobacillus arseniciselenatis]